jgi:hypothetical protein
MGRLFMTDATPLPLVVTASESFARRLPTQRVIDAVEHAEPGATFAELIQRQPMRLTAFRALLRDYPGHDVTSLWMHSYDVEVEVVSVDPTNGTSPTLAPPSGTTGEWIPTP